LAEELEFIFKEAIIKDETGTPIGLNIEKVESKPKPIADSLIFT
jgi:hypothetical protein